METNDANSFILYVAALHVIFSSVGNATML
jgi:hypothetical protein